MHRICRNSTRDGPHLADFSFDIGSPNLPVEVGRGVDLYLLADLKNLGLEVTGFVNFVDNYVIYMPTLETIRVFREGVRPRDTPVFEALAVDALFVGAEAGVHWWMGAGFSLHTTLSYVWAERRGDSDPLPFIPPLGGRVTLRYERSGFFGTLGVIAAFANLGFRGLSIQEACWKTHRNRRRATCWRPQVQAGAGIGVQRTTR